LGGAGHDVGAGGGLGLGRLGSQGDVAERPGVVDVHGDARRLGLRPGLVAVDIELGVAHLDWPDDANDAALAKSGAHHAEHVAALVRGGLVREHVGEPERVGGSAPGERDVREVGGNLLQRSAVLGSVGDHQVVSLAGVVADRGRGVLDDESAIGDGHLNVGPLLLDGVDPLDDRL